MLKDKKSTNSLKKIFTKFSIWVTKATGTPTAFLIALLVVFLWAISGSIFDYSETWQLIINTGTTIITFLMIFVIQQSQNRDTTAIHIKLNELIAANELTSNRLISSEDLTEEELDTIKSYYSKIAEISKKNRTLFDTHSLDEAEKSMEFKKHRSDINLKSKTKNT